LLYEHYVKVYQLQCIDPVVLHMCFDTLGTIPDPCMSNCGLRNGIMLCITVI